MSIASLRRISLLLIIWVVMEIGGAYGLNLEQVKQNFFARYGQIVSAEIFNGWLRLMNAMRSSNELDKVRQVNDFFNSGITFEDDYSLWDKRDYWATPLETMARGRGDCEDYSIAKYFSLLEQGVPVSKLRLVYVRATIEDLGGATIQQAHMVLAYYPKPNGEPLVLDNLNKKILPASQRRDLVPVFSFNSAGYWQGTGNQSSRSSISRWQDLLARARAEGFQ